MGIVCPLGGVTDRDAAAHGARFSSHQPDWSLGQYPRCVADGTDRPNRVCHFIGQLPVARPGPRLRFGVGRNDGAVGSMHGLGSTFSARFLSYSDSSGLAACRIFCGTVRARGSFARWATADSRDGRVDGRFLRRFDCHISICSAPDARRARSHRTGCGARGLAFSGVSWRTHHAA